MSSFLAPFESRITCVDNILRLSGHFGNYTKIYEGYNEEDLSIFTTELISTAQNFIRDNNGVSSVSLREIRRFIIFYEFFIKYLNIRKEIIIKEKIKEKETDIIKYANLTENEIKL